MSDWLIGVTAAAMLAAVANCLMPVGPVRQVGNLICAMMLLWAVLKPLAPLAGPWLDDFGITEQLQTSESNLREEREQLLKTLIEQECGAYIVDKAAQMDIVCRADVMCRMGEDGVWLPDRVCVTGTLTDRQRSELIRMISADLGVGSEHQEYLGGG